MSIYFISHSLHWFLPLMRFIVWLVMLNFQGLCFFSLSLFHGYTRLFTQILFLIIGHNFPEVEQALCVYLSWISSQSPAAAQQIQWINRLLNECARLCVRLPVSDVHHKHHQDEKQSFGQACALSGNHVRCFPQRPEPGIRIPQSLLWRYCWLHIRKLRSSFSGGFHS